MKVDSAFQRRLLGVVVGCSVSLSSVALADPPAPAISGYGVIGTDADTVTVGQKAAVSNGPIGGNGKVVIRSHALTGDITSRGNITVASQARTGNLTSMGTITVKPKATTGTLSPNTPVSTLTLPGVDANPDPTKNIRRKDKDAKQAPLTLAPGRYGELVGAQKDTIHLSSGTYDFTDITLRAKSTLKLTIVGGAPVVVRVAGSVTFGQGTTMQVGGGTAADVLFKTGDRIWLRAKGTYHGTFLAPLGNKMGKTADDGESDGDDEAEDPYDGHPTVILGQGAKLFGAAWGKDVWLRAKSQLAMLPYVHSDGLFPCLTDAACDDGNPCTNDVCSTTAGCSNVDNANPCDDGNACTQADQCMLGACFGFNPVVCAELDECHVAGSCDPTTGTCSNPNAANGLACTDDGNVCTSDTCQGGDCAHRAGNAGVLCRAAAGACDRAESCDGVDTSCPADFKSTAECRAAAGACDTAESCDGASNDCPADAKSTAECRAAAGACDTAESCDGASNDCPADASVAVGTSCSDGEPCNGQEACDGAGSCVAADNGEGAACDDGSACTGPDTCASGACSGGSVDCDDGNQCTDDYCDEPGGCVHDTVSCDDGNVCTDDSCDPSNGCANTENVRKCDDGDLCTANDACFERSCAGAALECLGDGCQEAGACDPATGLCVMGAVQPDGTACNDTNACTIGDTCTAGVCVSLPIDCDDGQACTTDFCDTAEGCVHAVQGCTGEVVNGRCFEAFGARRGDSRGSKTWSQARDYCQRRGAELASIDSEEDNGAVMNQVSNNCRSGRRRRRAPPAWIGLTDRVTEGTYAWTDGSPYDYTRLTPLSDEEYGAPADGVVILRSGTWVNAEEESLQACWVCERADHPYEACDDGNACSTDDICGANGCQGQGLVQCDDGELCTFDYCEPSVGTCVSLPAQCDDGDSCTLDGCDSATGTCFYTAEDLDGDGNADSCDACPGDANNDADSDGTCGNVDNCPALHNPDQIDLDNDGLGDPCDDAPADPTPGAVSTTDDSLVTSALEANRLVVPDSVLTLHLPRDATTPGRTLTAVRPGPCVEYQVTLGGLSDAAVAARPIVALRLPARDPAVARSFRNRTLAIATFEDTNSDGENDTWIEIPNCATGSTTADGRCSNAYGIDLDCSGTFETIHLTAALVELRTIRVQGTFEGETTCVGTSVDDPSTIGCSDGNACNGLETCNPTDGTCEHGVPPNCNDQNACTTDSCSAASGCTHVDLTATCDDGNGCTDDLCNPAAGCTNVNNAAACSDDNACSVGDECSGGVCVSGNTADCDDGNLCTDDSCDVGTGCVHLNNGVACSDGNVCTTSDTCAGGACIGGPATSCDDDNGCTDDTCNSTSGCTFTNNTAPCDDGNACTRSDACLGGGCVGANPIVCGTTGPCQVDQIVYFYGDCDTDDTPQRCDPTQQGTLTTGTDGHLRATFHVAPSHCSDIAVAFSVDGVLTHTTGRLTPGELAGEIDFGVASPGPHTITAQAFGFEGGCNGGTLISWAGTLSTRGLGTCNPTTGECGFTSAPDGIACSDGDACTASDVCGGGACTSGPAVSCDDANPCTDDACGTTTGCVHSNNTASCDDGNPCSAGEACVAGSCEGGTAVGCDDSNPCTVDACNPASGCTHDLSDADGDGVCNDTDNCPDSANGNQVDTDADGRGDACDACPIDPGKLQPGACGCDTADSDSDGDGVLDCAEECDADPLKTTPGTCGCGTADLDLDSDGTADCLDGCPADPDKIDPGTCGCGIADVDGDGDGYPACAGDCDDGNSSISPIAPELCDLLDNDCDGALGAGELDTDGDGVLDCADGCPTDSSKTAPGACGCGAPDVDDNLNGAIDCTEGGALTGTIDGKLTDESGTYDLGSVILDVGGVSVTTSANGSFTATVPAGATPVIISVPAGTYEFCLYGYCGYGTQASAAVTRPILVPVGGGQSLVIALPAVDATSAFAAGDGTIVTLGDGSSLTIPAGGVVDANGNPATSVTLTVAMLVPTFDNMDSAPGDYSGIDENGAAVQLESFGMVSATLTGPSGEELFLSQNATVRFPLAAGASFVAGDTIALWHFDDPTATWLQTGTATVIDVGGVLYVEASLPHFSWWNCDQPITTRHCIEVTLTNSGGELVEGGTVVASGVTYSGASTSGVITAGTTCVNVKRGSTVTLKYNPAADWGALAIPLGDVTVPDVNTTCATGGCTGVSYSVSSLTCLTGTLRTESGAPIPNQSILINGYYAAQSDASGNVSTTVFEGSLLNVQGTAYVGGNLLSSELVTITAASSVGSPCANHVELVVAGVACLSGTVVSASGLPMGNADITLSYVASGYSESFTTDSDGQFAAAVPLGEEILVQGVVSLGYRGGEEGGSNEARQTTSVTLVAGPSTGGECGNQVTLIGPDITCVTGTLTTEGGLPLSGQNVYAGASASYSAYTDDAGAFSMQVFKDEVLDVYAEVYVYSQGSYFAARTRSNTVLIAPVASTGGACPNNVALVTADLTCVTGTLVDGAGVPVPSIEVTSVTPLGNTTIALTGEDGTFSATIFSEPMTVSAEERILVYSGYPNYFYSTFARRSNSVALTPLAGGAGACPNSVALHLFDQTCLTGTLYDAAGQPAAIQPIISTLGDFTYSTTDGTFSMQVDADREVSIFSYGTDIVTFTPVAASLAGGPCVNDITLAVLAPTCVSGQVTNSAGAGLPYAYVNYYASPTFALDYGFGYGSVTTDANGNYCIPATPESVYTIYNASWIDEIGSTFYECGAATFSTVGSAPKDCGGATTCDAGPTMTCTPVVNGGGGAAL